MHIPAKLSSSLNLVVDAPSHPPPSRHTASNPPPPGSRREAASTQGGAQPKPIPDAPGGGRPTITIERDLTNLGSRLRVRYQRWVDDYARYTRMRGFATEINDWPFVRRSFLECWAEPGFHRFWQVWNPGISYFVYRLFVCLGGRRHWVAPTLLAFFFNGVVHNMAGVLLVGHWSVMFIVTFTSCGVLTVLSRYLAPILHQTRWPKVLNAAVNIGLVAGSFELGFRVDGLL